MEFSKDISTKQGYVWYVDIDYPMPAIGFISNSRFFDSLNWDCTAYLGNHLLVGDMIVSPSLDSIKIQP